MLVVYRFDKHQKMIKVLIKILITLLFITAMFSCREEAEITDINGHWHLHNEWLPWPNSYTKLDIRNDTVAIYEGVNVISFGDTVRIEENKKNIDVNKREMRLWTNGSYDRYRYQLTNDSLILENITLISGPMKFYGFQVSKERCTDMDHLYSERLVHIDLAVESKDDIVVKQGIPISFDIYLGFNKKGDQYMLEVNDKLVIESELEIEYEKFKAKFSQSYQQAINIVMHRHVNCPSKIVDSAIANIRTFYKRDIFEYKRQNNNVSEVVLTRAQY